VQCSCRLPAQSHEKVALQVNVLFLCAGAESASIHVASASSSTAVTELDDHRYVQGVHLPARPLLLLLERAHATFMDGGPH